MVEKLLLQLCYTFKGLGGVVVVPACTLVSKVGADDSGPNTPYVIHNEYGGDYWTSRENVTGDINPILDNKLNTRHLPIDLILNSNSKGSHIQQNSWNINHFCQPHWLALIF
jgi:hypothetical protein